MLKEGIFSVTVQADLRSIQSYMDKLSKNMEQSFAKAADRVMTEVITPASEELEKSVKSKISSEIRIGSIGGHIQSFSNRNFSIGNDGSAGFEYGLKVVGNFMEQDMVYGRVRFNENVPINYTAKAKNSVALIIPLSANAIRSPNKDNSNYDKKHYTLVKTDDGRAFLKDGNTFTHKLVYSTKQKHVDAVPNIKSSESRTVEKVREMYPIFVMEELRKRGY
jgi:hypothetical protein